MTTPALTLGVTCAMASAFFAGAATCYWWQTREQRAERRRQERDAHDARAFGVRRDYEFLMNTVAERKDAEGCTPGTMQTNAGIEGSNPSRVHQFRG